MDLEGSLTLCPLRKTIAETLSMGLVSSWPDLQHQAYISS